MYVNFTTVAGRNLTVVEFSPAQADKEAEVVAALNKGEQVTFTMAPSTKEEFENGGSGEEPTPSIDPTIKATLSGSPEKATFFAYYTDGETAPVLTEDQIKATIETAKNETVIKLDMKEGEATTDAGHTVKFDLKGVGSYKLPNQLFKVTVRGLEDPQYIAAGGKLTDLGDDLAALLPADIVAAENPNNDSKVILVTGGSATVTTIAKDMELVPALKYATNGTEFTSLSTAKLKLYAYPKSGAPVHINAKAPSSNDTARYVQKGAELRFGADTGATVNGKFTLTVNGKKTEGQFNADGICNISVIPGVNAADPTLLVVSSSAVVAATSTYDIYLDGTKVATAADITKGVKIGSVTGGAVLAVEKTDSKGNKALSAPDGTIDASTGEAWYTHNADGDVDSKGNKAINLVTAYKVTTNANAKWVADLELNKDGDDLKTSGGTIKNATDGYVRAGTTIYVQAGTADTTLKLSEDAEGMTISANPVAATAGDNVDKKIYTLVVNGPVAASDIEEALKVSSKDVVSPSAKAPAAGADPTEFKFDLTVNGIADEAAFDEILLDAHWSKFAMNDSLAVKKIAFKETDTLTVTATSTNAIQGSGDDHTTGAEVGTLTVKINGMSIDFNITCETAVTV